MVKTIIVLSGAPASGKDTITKELHKLDPRYVLLKKYRSINSNERIKNCYYNITEKEFLVKINNNDFLEYHKRYNRYYGVAKVTLQSILYKNSVPIIHIGRIENYYNLCKSISNFKKDNNCKIRIIHILLWETVTILMNRINNRDRTKEEINKRLIALCQEYFDLFELLSNNVNPFTLVIKNSSINVTCNSIVNLEKFNKIENDSYNEFYNYLKIYKKEIR